MSEKRASCVELNKLVLARLPVHVNVDVGVNGDILE